MSVLHRRFGVAWSTQHELCEAMCQRLCCGAAQPQCAMKEHPAAVLVRHDVDRLGRASSASNKSGSLELLRTLHALVGATTCGAQTGAATQLERVALRRPAFSGAHRHV